MAVTFLMSFYAFGDSGLDRCLVEATAKNAQDYNCSKYLEQQDENVAVTVSDKQMYSQCMKMKEQDAAASAQKCQEQFAKKSDPLLNESEELAGKDPAVTPKKDPSRIPSDPAAKPAKASSANKPAQASTPKTDRETSTKPATASATPKSTTSLADAQAQIQADLDQCTNLQNQASRCCGNPMNCAGSMSRSDQQSLAQLLQSQNQQAGQSMTDYCNQLQTQSANSGSVNRALAQVCMSPASSCSSTCESMSQKYLNLANSNQGTDVGNAYLSAADQLTNASNDCNRQQARGTQLAAQGISSGGTQSMSAACQQASAANPSTMQTPNGNPVPTSPATQAKLDATVNCQANPNAAECLNQNRAQGGKSGFDAQAQAKRDPEFDVPDAGTRSTDYFANNAQTQSTAAKVNTVPNNSGGGFGIGDGGSSQASLNSNARRPSPGSPGYTTDIMQGTMSGGGYSYGSGSGSGLEDQSYFGRFFGGGNKRQKNDNGGMLGMDLRQFLPGGSRARRALAGFNGHSEINAKEEDIWRRISNKMVEKCKLGVLWRCE